MERRWAAPATDNSRDELYRRDANMRAREYTGYRHVAACSVCDVRSICDGFHGDYKDLFGEAEARPVQLGGPVSEPQHFSKEQVKRIHPEDLGWLTGERTAEQGRCEPGKSGPAFPLK
jgi:hypothetical protein